MKRLATCIAAVLLVTPMAAKAEPIFLRCDLKGGSGTYQWNLTLNEAASTVSLSTSKRSETVLGAFSPESVAWKFVSGGGEVQVLFRLNRLTGEINNRIVFPSSWSKKNKEAAKRAAGSGFCKVREAPTERMF